MLKSIVFYMNCLVDATVNRFMLKHKFRISNPVETVDCVVDHKVSICRYGDGEFNLIKGRGNGFQKHDKELAAKLKLILTSEQKHCRIAIPSILNSGSNIKFKPWLLWQHLIRSFRDVLPTKDVSYLDSLVTRPYMDYKNKDDSAYIFDRFKELFSERDILIVEGKNSRLGVGNDLLDGASSLRRILCPNINSFDFYDSIKKSILSNIKNDEMVVIALGPTATVLAWELSELGIRSLDLGHVDVEYEWYLSGAKCKKEITGKNVNELGLNLSTTKADNIETIYQGSTIIDEIK